MKQLKMLGLAVVAVLAMTALAGAGTASATVLCKTNTTPCAAGQMFEAGQELHMENEANFTLTAGFADLTCEFVTLKGTQLNTGSATETVEYGLDETSITTSNGWKQKTGLHFENCTAENVEVLSAGKLILHYVTGTMNATVTWVGGSIVFKQAGVQCAYGTKSAAADIGTLTATNVTGGTPTLDFSAEMMKEAGGFLCANPAHWAGSFKITTPMEAYVAES